MTRAVEHIERDIAALEQSVTAIAQDLHTTYSDYLTDLGQAVKRQLVLAAYHICTQGYPDRFLHLPLSQRQDLQQTLKQLAQNAQVQLVSRLKSFEEVHLTSQEDLLRNEVTEREHRLSDEEQADEQVDAEQVDDEQANDEATDEQIGTDQADDEQADDEQEDDEQEDELSSEELLRESLSLTSGFSGVFFSEGDRSNEQNHIRFEWFGTPEINHFSAAPDAAAQKVDVAQALSDPRWVMSWQENLEKGIAAVLQSLSYATNHLLQQTDILPAKLPEPILEVAAQAGAEIATGPPNVLNLLLEAEGNSKTEAKMTHIMAIRLRLSEIEFADPTLGAWRSKIRGLLARLNQLGRDYQKKQREKAIATAEAAWRSTWFDE